MNRNYRMNIFNTKTCILIILMIAALSGSLFSQYDHKQVMLNQIRRLEARREFSRAIEIYEELLERYESDQEIVGSYFNTLMNLNRIGEAEELIRKHEQHIEEERLVRHRIVIASRKGEIKRAKELGIEFVNQNPGVINLYRDFASIYERERQNETAIDFLLLGRRRSNDENLFALELARNYESSAQYEEAVIEYANHLDRNPGFLFFVTNRVRNIVDQDQNLLNVLDTIVGETEKEPLLELYAMILAHTKHYEEAFTIYQKLSSEKIYNFAEELKATGELELARIAYETYIERINDTAKAAEIEIKIAGILITQENYTDARDVLLNVTANEAIQDRQYRFRTRANKESRELLAEIAIKTNQPANEVVNWFEDAKRFAFNRNEQKELELRVVHYLTMNGQYSEARIKMDQILAGETSGSHIHNLGFYYHFIVDLMQNNSVTDSFLTELIVSIPGSELTNETLFLTIVTQEMTAQEKDKFLEAYRLKSLYKQGEAIEKIMELFTVESGDNFFTMPEQLINETPLYNEHLVIIAATWAISANQQELADRLLSYDFENETLKGYATLRLFDLDRETDQKPYQERVTTFLQDYPTHVFSPQLRLILTGKD
jgi:thioredoxin-like negative regulator of GroEL